MDNQKGEPQLTTNENFQEPNANLVQETTSATVTASSPNKNMKRLIIVMLVFSVVALFSVLLLWLTREGLSSRGSCTVNGVEYKDGSVVEMGNDCQSCTCSDGGLNCMDIDCDANGLVEEAETILPTEKEEEIVWETRSLECNSDLYEDYLLTASLPEGTGLTQQLMYDNCVFTITYGESALIIELPVGEQTARSYDSIEKVGPTEKGDIYKTYVTATQDECLLYGSQTGDVEEARGCEMYIYGYYKGENPCYPNDKECGYLQGVKKYLIEYGVNSDNLESMNTVLLRLLGDDAGDEDVTELFDKIVLGVKVNQR